MEIIIFDDAKINTAQTGTMIGTSVPLQRNSVMTMKHPSHPVKAWRHMRPMMMTMTPVRIPKAASGLKTVLRRKSIPGLH